MVSSLAAYTVLAYGQTGYVVGAKHVWWLVSIILVDGKHMFCTSCTE